MRARKVSAIFTGLAGNTGPGIAYNFAHLGQKETTLRTKLQIKAFI